MKDVLNQVQNSMICNESPVAYKSLSLETLLFLSLFLFSLPYTLYLSLHTRNTDTRRGFVATGHTLISAYHHQPTVAAWGSITHQLMDFSPYPAPDLALKRAINSIFDQQFVRQCKSTTACFAHQLYQTAFIDAQNAQYNILLHILTLLVEQLD